MNSSIWLKRAIELVSRGVIRPQDAFTVMLGEKPQTTMLSAVVYPQVLWQEEPLRAKLASLVKRKWKPNDDAIRRVAEQTFKDEVFGGEDDLR